jgi:hypothetical protein
MSISTSEDLLVLEHREEDATSLFEQEFSEQDVLPFLLQAQDIISKLESRVVELENDLFVCNFHDSSISIHNILIYIYIYITFIRRFTVNMNMIAMNG